MAKATAAVLLAFAAACQAAVSRDLYGGVLRAGMRTPCWESLALIRPRRWAVDGASGCDVD